MNTKIYVIYKITNMISGKVYIGQTSKVNPHIRVQSHFNKQPIPSLISTAIQQYGKTNFHCSFLLSTKSNLDADYFEKLFIKICNSQSPNGYNVQNGGSHHFDYTDEFKQKQSLIKKEYYKHNISWAKGKKFTKEHCESLSKVRKGFTSPARELAAIKRIEASKIAIYAINLKTNERVRFESLNDCANALNLSASCITRVLNGKQGRKQHKGFRFEKASA